VRPAILNSGYPLHLKLVFKLVEFVTREPMPDAARINFYRSDFYGSPMKQLTHQAMRGKSRWSVGERELMAAYVSRVNRSDFCISTHSATATTALQDETLVALALGDFERAPVQEPLHSTLRLLGKLTRENTITADDVDAVLAAGASAEQIEQALAVCFAFNVINRLAEAFDFAKLTPDGYTKGAKYLLKHGYR
jgi:AhpD family alkylhydroperoxidase